MGVRISAYSVDLIRLDRLLDATLGDLLLVYVQKVAATNRAFNWGDFHAIPQKGVFHPVRPSTHPLTVAQIEGDPFLQTPARTQLQEDSGLQLDWFLHAVSVITESDAVRRLTHGDRRWWIGSLLQAARRTFDRGSYYRLEEVLLRMLRVYNCGLHVPRTPYTLADVEFPVVPGDDTDHWMSVWTPGEIEHVVQCFQILKSSSLQFSHPHGNVGMGPETPEEWNDWVREMMDRFLVLPEQTPESLRVVTFIS